MFRKFPLIISYLSLGIKYKYIFINKIIKFIFIIIIIIILLLFFYLFIIIRIR